MQNFISKSGLSSQPDDYAPPNKYKLVMELPLIESFNDNFNEKSFRGIKKNLKFI